LVTLLLVSMTTASESCSTRVDSTDEKCPGQVDTKPDEKLPDGSCPDFKVVAPLDLQRYLGTWYEYARYDAAFQKDARCVTATYSDNTNYDDGEPRIGVLNKSIKDGRDTFSTSTGEAVFSNPNDPNLPARLIVNFDGQPESDKYVSDNYNVVYTDYDSLAVVYACSSRGEYLYILTRTKEPYQALVDLAYLKIQDSNIDTTRLIVTDQDNCPDTSGENTPDQGDRTDESCPDFNVVAPLDLQRYLGTWYEYARYEAAFERNARCVTATYSDNTSDGEPRIGVLNKSIRDGRDTYSTSTGEAVFSNPNDPKLPARLIVNFDGQPESDKYVSDNYNVVYTDYDSLSVVYACGSRGEYLFILTRQRLPYQALVDLAYQKMQESSIDTSRLIVTDQNNCPDQV